MKLTSGDAFAFDQAIRANAAVRTPAAVAVNSVLVVENVFFICFPALSCVALPFGLVRFIRVGECLYVCVPVCTGVYLHLLYVNSFVRLNRTWAPVTDNRLGLFYTPPTTAAAAAAQMLHQNFCFNSDIRRFVSWSRRSHDERK